MQDYSPCEKFLHWLALDSAVRNEFAFDLEKALFLDSSPEPTIHNHVFVQGLARAGTTILMREIYGTGQFSSLTYRDMPFVICCNAWAVVTKLSRREIGPKERAHGDGIAVDMDSPEALDEVFWRVFAGKEYLQKDRLVVHTPQAETLNHLVEYIRLILRRANGNRYLSKDNNNILRLPSLIKRFPDSVFLIPVRRPLQHAFSLLRQHMRFSNSDSYTQRYMTWLGHHEFGATHRPFRFPDVATVTDASPQSINYWLAQWLNCYTYLYRVISKCGNNAYFVPYEQLCQNPTVWAAIMKRIGLPPNNTATFKQRENRIDQPINTSIRKPSEALYEAISCKALDKLVGADS